MCASFIRVTDCSIRVSRSFARGLQPPAQGCYTYMIIRMIEIFNIAAQPYDLQELSNLVNSYGP